MYTSTGFILAIQEKTFLYPFDESWTELVYFFSRHENKIHYKDKKKMYKYLKKMYTVICQKYWEM